MQQFLFDILTRSLRTQLTICPLPAKPIFSFRHICYFNRQCAFLLAKYMAILSKTLMVLTCCLAMIQRLLRNRYTTSKWHAFSSITSCGRLFRRWFARSAPIVSLYSTFLREKHTHSNGWSTIYFYLFFLLIFTNIYITALFTSPYWLRLKQQIGDSNMNVQRAAVYRNRLLYTPTNFIISQLWNRCT